MRYVLDSSVALKWVLPEDDSDKALALRDGRHHLIAPDIFHVETLHALTKAERQGRISTGDGWPLWQSIMAYCPISHPYHSLLGRAYQIASSARSGIYDCLYVALAEEEDCELVTADERLARKFSSHPVVSLSSL